MERFDFQNPCARILDTGNQVCNCYIAINNGGLTGVGLGNSTQKYLYLPEPYTDFIFAIIVEELGPIPNPQSPIPNPQSPFNLL
jgi:cell division protein FtsW